MACGVHREAQQFRTAADDLVRTLDVQIGFLLSGEGQTR